MVDAVLGYHTNPHTCGVAKFNYRLAKELGVDFDHIGNIAHHSHPLVSLKLSEVHSGEHWFPGCGISINQRYDLFLHDWRTFSHFSDRQWVDYAHTIYCANPVIARAVALDAKYRPMRCVEVIEAWCPSTVEGNATRGTINVLTFGMAGKIDQQLGRYAKLKEFLDATGSDYTVCVSTAVHEGSPWDDTARVGDRLRGVFNDRLRVLGYLADDGLAAELQRCTAVAVFFDPALRANNTTFWAAVDAGKPVISNLDEDSPKPLCYDIDVMTEWWTPMPPHRLAASSSEQWRRLLALMQEQPCASSR